MNKIFRRHNFLLSMVIGGLNLLLAVSCGSELIPLGDGTDLEDGVSSGEHRIFVSSNTYNGNLGGVDAADTLCDNLAEIAGLTLNYKALLSATSNPAKNRINIEGEVYLVSASGTKTKIADSYSDLWDGSIRSAINLNESGASVSSATPWTGTNSSGNESIDNCNDWTSASSGVDGDVGSTSSTGSEWVAKVAFQNCSQYNRLYCISQ